MIRTNFCPKCRWMCVTDAANNGLCVSSMGQRVDGFFVGGLPLVVETAAMRLDEGIGAVFCGCDADDPVALIKVAAITREDAERMTQEDVDDEIG